MQALDQILGSAVDEVVGMAPAIAGALIVFALSLVLGAGAGAAIDRLARRGSRGRRSGGFVTRAIRWTLGLLGLILALQILGLTAVATSLLATGGFVAIILGFAFREIGENLLAGMVLGVSRSFEVGDLIDSSGHTGKVVEIDLRHVHIRTGDGRDVFIPSAQILRNVLVNYTRDDLRRGEFVIGVDYGESLDRALELALGSVRAVDGVLEDPPLAARLEAFAPQYVELKITFWVNTETSAGLSQVRSDAMRACLGALREEGMKVSADVSSAVALAPVEVRVDR